MWGGCGAIQHVEWVWSDTACRLSVGLAGSMTMFSAAMLFILYICGPDELQMRRWAGGVKRCLPEANGIER